MEQVGNNTAEISSILQSGNNIISNLIIQWGQSTATGWRTVNFPTTYRMTNPVVTVTINDDSQLFISTGVLGISKDNFMIKLSRSDASISVFWISFGY